jgi:hypothetical protein
MRVFWNWRERRWPWRPSVASAATAGAGGWGLGAREDVGFEKRDAVEAPGGVGEFVD